MPANQPWSERQKIPLRACGHEHLFGVNADTLEYHCEFIHKCDIHIALRVLDHLGRFGNLDARCHVRTGGDDRCIDRIDELSGFLRRTRRHFEDGWQPMLFVTRVNSFRAVANKKVFVQLETGFFFKNRHTEFLGRTRIDRRFKDNDVTLADDAAQGRTRGSQ